ncbi:MAG: nucleoside phosphorylase [Bdellovibrionales bacterium]|nr:nucleoside phosphorylase [Bdellovibrionales bacterium]
MKPHIKLSPDKRFQRALVCGAPERAEKIAGRLKKMQVLAKNREYHSFIGEYDGKEVMVVSHGVGAPGAAICFQELIDVGVKSMVRLGTAGALQDHLGIGSIVLAEGAVRRDGLTAQMLPQGFPAIAHRQALSELEKSFERSGVKAHTGLVLTADLFYPGLRDNKLAYYAKAGVAAVEMECSALFILGHLRGVKTGAALVLDGNPMKWKEGNYDPAGTKMAQAMDQAIDATLAAVARL